MTCYKERGKWRYEFQHMGKRYRSGYYNTKAEARAAREEHRTKIKKEMGAIKKTAMGFLQLSEEYLDYWERRSQDDKKKKTYKEKLFVHKSFLAFLGQDIDIRQISPRIVTSYLSLRPSNSNWNKHRKNLCAFFEWCFRHGMIEKNPCLNVAKMPVEFNRKQIPTEEEMTRVIMAAGEHRPFLMVLFYTMARIDEILRLRWEDVNFQERIVKLWTKKTSDGSWRCDLFPMEEGLYQVLQGLWQKSRGKPEWVFFNPKTSDRYWDRRKIIKNICMKAGVRPFGYHAIRHFVASLLADRGKESMKTMQELLRHRRQSTTEIYLQKFDDNLRQAAGKIEGFFESSPQKFPAKEKEAGE